MALATSLARRSGSTVLRVPELVEVEIYRRQADAMVGRTVAGVDAQDLWFLKGATTPSGLDTSLVGRTVTATDRRGKLLLLDLDGVSLGLRFGMTGRLVVDGGAAIEELLYSTTRHDEAYERFRLHFADGGSMVMVDPRRLGGVELEPDVSRLGPDAASITKRQLATALAGSTVALKARLLDQARVAGIGNLIADETLWRAGVDPTRESRSLSDAEVGALARRVRSTIAMLLRRGGSHTGDLQDERHREGRCPRDGEPLTRETVGGRTTYWCPHHQH